ncbi:MAG: sulfite exporter TauE/SafE family protein [Pseudomonadota bacterium]
MQLYLPIAEMAVNPLLMIGIGVLVGAISGLFGIGGGFILTPLLMLSGIPAPIAVVAGANVSAAASMSSFMVQMERKALDLRLGLVMSISGVVGVGFGASIFRWFQGLGLAEVLVQVSYVILLGFVGYSLVSESWRSLTGSANEGAPKLRSRRKSELAYTLPLKVKFSRSRLYISIIPPVVIGFVIGILSAIMGVGGGFLLIPALVYLINMPPSLVVGTSIFQVLIMASTTSFVQASANGGLDIVLTLILICGAVIGSQLGTIFGRKFNAEQLRLLLGGMILILCLILASQLILKPSDIFDISSAGGGL